VAPAKPAGLVDAGGLDVPGAVVHAVVGSSDSFSRIHDRSARLPTPYLRGKLHGRELPRLQITRPEVLESVRDPYDVEDLVYVWPPDRAGVSGASHVRAGPTRPPTSRR
jgi:hypothetical protein